MGSGPEEQRPAEVPKMNIPAQIFLAANSLAMLCWAALAICLFVHRLQFWIPRLTGFVVPVLFAVVYGIRPVRR
jgi:hypothetical protein